jgi:hypothetical protein
VGKKSRGVHGDRFVVDLPDGQKLYVGDLEEGMALEVATWRGIGEPDSRVARMIIAATRAVPSDKSDAVMVPAGANGEISSVGAGATPKGTTTPLPREKEAKLPVPSRRVTYLRRATASVVALPFMAAVAAILTGSIALAQPVPSLAAEMELGASSLLVAIPKGEYAKGDEVLARVSSDSNQAAVVAQVVEVGSDTVTIAASGTLVELSQSQVIGQLVGTLPVGADLVDRPLLAAAMAAALIIGLLLFAL